MKISEVFCQTERYQLISVKILDIIEYCEKENNDISAFIYSCDFQKCFDKVSFTALIGALKYFQFGDRIV